MSNRPSVGVGVIVTKDEEVLLIKRQGMHGYGCWCPPGGHVEYGETFEECARREALEETGIEVGTVAFRAVTNNVFLEESKHSVTIWFEGQYVAGEPTITAPREISEVGWFAWDELPEPHFLPWRSWLEGETYPPTIQTS